MESTFVIKMELLRNEPDTYSIRQGLSYFMLRLDGRKSLRKIFSPMPLEHPITFAMSIHGSAMENIHLKYSLVLKLLPRYDTYIHLGAHSTHLVQNFKQAKKIISGTVDPALAYA